MAESQGIPCLRGRMRLGECCKVTSSRSTTCCSCTRSYGRPIRAQSCANAGSSRRCDPQKSNWINSGCNCSTAQSLRRTSGHACNFDLHRQRILMEYLWKQEAEPHKGTCACCDVSRKFRQCSPNGQPCKCPCVDSGHKTHFFCNATDQNERLARVAALRYKIRKAVKWLLINLTIFIIVFFDEDFPKILQAIITTVNILNMCYYIQKLVKLYIALVKMKLERPAYWTKNCLWEKNLPQDLTRYFEDSSEKFLSRYCLYFCSLVSALRNVRASPLGRMETETGMEQELKTLGETFLKARGSELRARSKIQDAKYRLPQMKRIKQPVWTQKQLEKYWKNYAEACEEEQVRLSKDQLQFRPNVCSTPSPGYLLSTSQTKSEDYSSYTEVAVSPILRTSMYQHACENDVHPSPAVPSGSFYDFMKIHHRIDYCSSLRWVANLKFWLGDRIKEIVRQFNVANQMLASHGAANTQIGVSSIADLQTALRTNQELFTFTPLLAFLTVTHNQRYLVSRYRILASQPCLTSYSWRSGGDQRGKWAPDSGPCDSEIVLHFFCSYMDMTLPDLTFHPTKKRPFTDHYVTSSDKLSEAVGEITIVRQWVNPPHFNVYVKGRVYEIPGGSNNLFLALAYLIYCIKLYQQGKIGRISLDQPGLNLLWILGSNNNT